MAAHSWDDLHLDAPIVLGPFGGVSSVALTAAVSNLGGLGSFGLYGFDGARIAETGAALHAATDKPFSLNLWVPMGNEVAPEDVDWAAAERALAPLFAEVGVAFPERPSSFMPSFAEQIDAAIAARPTALSFVFGVPTLDVVRRAHDAGIVVIGTATSVAEAQALEVGGVDAIVATGLEAGGHRVSFLAPPEQSLVGTLALVPAVVAAVGVPVVAAGGIATRAGVCAALDLGAAGVQVGSAFLATEESAAPPSHRAALRTADATSSVLTRAMSGRLSRGIRNRAVDEIEASGMILPFPAQNWLTGKFRAAASTQDNPELLSLWAGQSSALAHGETAEAVFRSLLP